MPDMSNPSLPNNNATDTEEIDLHKLLGTLWFHKYKIISAAVLGALLAGTYAFGTAPVYQADALLEIESRQAGVLGDLENLLSSGSVDQTDGEIELIKSRLVIGRTVRALNLEYDIQPRYTPVIGRLAANLSGEEPPVLKIESFSVKTDWLNEAFLLRLEDKVNFTLKDPSGQIHQGQIGKPLKFGDNQLTIQQVLAQPGQEFTLRRRSFLASVEQLKENLSASAKGKNSPIIGLSYQDKDPKRAQQVLNSVLEHYALQNKEQETQIAANGLQFIQQELPGLKRELEQAEDKLNAYRIRHGSLDIPQEAKGTLESLTKIEMQMTELRTEQAGLAELYTAEHPAMRAVGDKLKVLENAKATINAQISRLPEIQQEIIRLSRDVEINRAIYVQLLNKQQELDILKASSAGSVRIVDTAMTAELPVKPKRPIIVLLGFVLGGLLASGFYLMRSALHRGIKSQDEIQLLGLNVYTSIPFSEIQRKRDKILQALKRNKDVRSDTLLAFEDPSDVAVEALRALRTTLFFSIMDSANNILTVSGPAPGVGKSFVSSNLAAVMTQAEKRVLVVDADMRKGYLHEMMGGRAEHGLSEILAGQLTFSDAVQAVKDGRIHFISRGSIPDNPSELLHRPKLAEFMSWASQHYDYVLLDTPPILAVTDAAVLAQHSGTTLLVARFGETSLDELQESIIRFQHNNVSISGAILNGVQRTAETYGRYGTYSTYSNKYGGN